MPRSADAVRRFSAVWAASLGVKLAALAVFAYLLWRLYGGLA